MTNKLFVGGLAWATTDETLRDGFSQAGEVTSATVLKDKMTGQSRGFGFVEMATEEAAKNAIAMLDGKDFDGRTIRVDFAKPKAEGFNAR